jgi:hypothetical protein
MTLLKCCRLRFERLNGGADALYAGTSVFRSAVVCRRCCWCYVVTAPARKWRNTAMAATSTGAACASAPKATSADPESSTTHCSGFRVRAKSAPRNDDYSTPPQFSRMALLQTSQQRNSVRLPPFRFRRHIASELGFFRAPGGARNPVSAFVCCFKVGEFGCRILR